MSFFPNLLNSIVYKNPSVVPDYPKSVALKPSRLHAYAKWAPRYAGVFNFLPAALVLGGFFVYPTLTERFKWTVGLPTTYVPTEEDLKA